MRRAGVSRPAVWALVVLVLAACGSTVQVGNRPSGAGNGLAASTAGPAGQVGGGAGPDGAAAAGGAGQPGTAAARAADTGPSGSSAPGDVAGGGAGAANGALPGAPGAARPATVRLGIVYLKDLGAAYQAAGAKQAGTTDSQADYQAVIADINAHGGAAGHRLVPFFYAIDAASTTAPGTQLQAACAQFTQDQPVDAVLSYTPGSNDVLASCLAAKHVPLIIGFDESDVARTTLAADPLVWEPAEVSLNRLEDVLPGFLIGHHWDDARWGSDARCAAFGPRIGVITFDAPDYRAAYQADLQPAFKAAGHPVYEVDFVNVSGTTANQLADASTAVQNAVLKFSTDCIDHVVFASNVAVDYLFMDVADQQHYRPRYGLSSLEAPPVIVDNLSNPTGQLHGALAIGWSPFSDVRSQDFDAAAQAPAQHCLQVLQRAGLAPTDNNSAILALPACDGPGFAAAAFGRWFGSPASAGLLGAVDGLGSAYRPAGSFTAQIDRSRHDGASAYRPTAFVDSCTCFRYTAGLQSW